MSCCEKNHDDERHPKKKVVLLKTSFFSCCLKLVTVSLVFDFVPLEPIQIHFMTGLYPAKDLTYPYGTGNSSSQQKNASDATKGRVSWP